MPCSRSRINAAPTRIMVSMVTILIHFHHAAKPVADQVRVVTHPCCQADRCIARSRLPAQVFIEFGNENRADIAGADKRLTHAGGVDVQLNRWPVAHGAQVCWKLAGITIAKSDLTMIGIRSICGNSMRCAGEIGLGQRANQALRQGRTIFVDHRHRRIVQFRRHPWPQHKSRR